MSETTKAPGSLYHLYNRGTDKRRIFTDRRDHERFIALLYFCNSSKPVRLDDLYRFHSQGRTLRNMFGEFDRNETLVELYAYCLMPNHFHILLKETAAGNTAKFMQKVSNGYTGYFNKKYKRSGTLFEGGYKAQRVDDDRYLKYLLSYIHLNPVKLIEPQWKEAGIRAPAKAEGFLQDYEYSSFLDYCGIERPEKHVLSIESFKSFYDDATPHNFKTSVEEWLANSQGPTLRVEKIGK